MPINLLPRLLEIVFPTCCVSCRKASKLFCEGCRGSLKSLDGFFCIVCDRPAVGGFTHPGCATKFTPERALAGFSYNGPAKDLVGALKYKRVRKIAEIMADLLLEDLDEKGIEFGTKAIVVPIPLSFWREGARGFNQSALLGEELAGRLGLSFRGDVLARVKDTPSQVSLTKEERAANVRGAFLARSLKGEDVLLVDDVTTTGVTAREAAKELKKSGAGQVWVLTFAKD